MVFTLAALEQAVRRSRPVHLRNFSQRHAHMQGNEIATKPQANMPTASKLYGDVRLKGTDGGTIDWQCFGAGSQPVVDVPAWLAALFDAQCYTAQFTGHEGFWYAAMFGLDVHFVTRTDKDQTRCVLDMKQQMAIELDQYYQKYRYRQFGYSKADMYTVLNRSDAYHSSLGHYLSDFLNLNLLVVLKEKRYYWVGKPSESRVTLVLYNDEITWGSIVHPDQRSHLFADVDFITTRHMHLTDFDIGQMVLSMDDVQVKNIRRELRKMKVKELHAKARDLEIHLTDVDGKRKLKNALMAEIFLELTGQTMGGDGSDGRGKGKAKTQDAPTEIGDDGSSSGSDPLELHESHESHESHEEPVAMVTSSASTTPAERFAVSTSIMDYAQAVDTPAAMVVVDDDVGNGGASAVEAFL